MFDLFELFCVVAMLLIASMISYACGYIRGIECFSMECYHKGKLLRWKTAEEIIEEELRD